MQIPVSRISPLDTLNHFLRGTGFKKRFLSEVVLANAPIFETLQVNYAFDPLGKPGEVISPNKVDEIYASKYGCRHIPDFVGVCAMIVADPSILGAGPIAIQWVDGNGRICDALWGNRAVAVGLNGADWSGSFRCPRPRE